MDRLITYTRSTPFGELGPSSGAVVVLINEQHIRNMLDNLEDAHKAKILVADKEGRLLTQSSGCELFRGVELDTDNIEPSWLGIPRSILRTIRSA
jgi:hypothetical protein